MARAAEAKAVDSAVIGVAAARVVVAALGVAAFLGVAALGAVAVLWGMRRRHRRSRRWQTCYEDGSSRLIASMPTTLRRHID